MHGRKKILISVKISTLAKYTSININKAVTKYFYYRNEALWIQRNVQREVFLPWIPLWCDCQIIKIYKGMRREEISRKYTLFKDMNEDINTSHPPDGGTRMTFFHCSQMVFDRLSFCSFSQTYSPASHWHPCFLYVSKTHGTSDTHMRPTTTHHTGSDTPSNTLHAVRAWKSHCLQF